jgi:23S rRNA pseudouridine2605 synthase
MSKKTSRPDSKGSERGKNTSEKKTNTDRKPKPSSFNRSREESRPSDFDENRKPPTTRTGAGKPPFKKSYSKPAVKRSSDFDEEKPARNSERTSNSRSTGSKPLFKKSYSKPAVESSSDFNEDKPTRTSERTIGSRSAGAKPLYKKTYSKSTTGFNKHRSDDKKPDSSFPSKPKENDGSIRLNKYLSNAGICSRREADTLITSGVVKVNGKVITELGYKINPTDIVNYGGQTLKKERPMYLILNKPKDYITTADDPQERKTVLHLIAGACRERIYPVGRLDRNTTGLLLFTNDGDLTKKLTHPRYGIKKTYHVELDHPLKQSHLTEISEGIELEDGPMKVDVIAYVGNGADKTQVGVEIHSGKNRIVRRIFEHFGYKVKRLDRVTFGPLTKKDLPRGRWRMLTEAEIGMLKMISVKD